MLWLRNKSDFDEAFIQFCKDKEIKHGQTIVVVHGDGGELDTNEIKAYFKSHTPNHIEWQPSPPRTQALNGQVERHVGILRGRAECILAAANLPQKMFNFAMEYVVHVDRALVHKRPQLTRLSDKKGAESKLRGLSPYEQVYGRMPDYSKFHPFGCLVAVYVDKALRTEVFNELNRMKLLKGSRLWKAEPGMFLGYKSQRIAYVYLYRTRRIHEVFHFRPCKRIFPGFSLQAHHLNPLLTWDKFGTDFSDAELTGETDKPDITPNEGWMNDFK